MMESGPSPVASRGKSEEARYWDERYKAGQLSGSGSYGDTLARKLKALAPLEVKSILEIGCGDFNFGKNLCFQYKLPLSAYTGFDISEVILERNKRFYPDAHWKLLQPGVTNVLDFPKADLLLAVDVLYHIYEDATYNRFLADLKRLWHGARYLAVTAYDRDPEPFEQQGHLRLRHFDPSYFGTPISKEVIEDEGSLKLFIYDRTQQG